eukprot:CAMPEP_0171939682 /NCGR_PEP_ID=MMETSP0993-20121228/36516_1 /TAXON_ID=483369 /ORGANISM="non described non described, Strain CCMP2098" /LENGTH=601 /DNA_ID=CAMNT_0012581575 /DNA_START=397 /DNA_END=2202 /DNA_ORIENTATION=+
MDQRIWTQGVIPTKLDAWIWAGDMAYLDNPTVLCDDASGEGGENEHKQVSGSPQCHCEPSWLASMPHSCMAGQVQHAASRWEAYLGNPDYKLFLEDMCPGAMAKGEFPPVGPLCPRPILGTYDDHDFGWNNGNHREPDKQAFKSMFLDAIGEDPRSPRRGDLRGAWGSHTLRIPSSGGVEVEVFLLDERWDRDNLPCWTRRKACEAALEDSSSSASYRAWCAEFLHNGTEFGVTGRGSCCDKDERLWFKWCNAQRAAKAVNAEYEHPLFREACDVVHFGWGTRMLWLSDDGEVLTDKPPPPSSQLEQSDIEQSGGASSFSRYTEDEQQGSPHCEVLGRQQRAWLRGALEASTAPLKLLVSGSVLLGNPVSQGPFDSFCSGDDLDCYAAAQAELMHLAAVATKGCVLVLTGDYHWSDIKVLTPGNNAATYRVGMGEMENSGEQQFPESGLVQVMASGLTTSTSPNVSCAEFLARGYTTDPLGLREGFAPSSGSGGSSSSSSSSSGGSNGGGGEGEGPAAEANARTGQEPEAASEGGAWQGVLAGATSAEEARACSALVGGSFATVEAEVSHGALRKVHIRLRDKHGHARYTKTIDAGSCRPL